MDKKPKLYKFTDIEKNFEHALEGIFMLPERNIFLTYRRFIEKKLQI